MDIKTSVQEIRNRFHPTFWVANGMELFERLAYYGQQIVFMIYLRNKLGFSETEAGQLSGIFGGLIYLLPILGGTLADILSHDFVEAALIRRGGWSVSIAHDLEGSLPGKSLFHRRSGGARPALVPRQSPARARRADASGLTWVSRLHMVSGTFRIWLRRYGCCSSSPVWRWDSIMNSCGRGLKHFPTLFPVWPLVDPVRAMRLFGVTMAILLGPKIFGALSILASPRRLLATGGLLPFSVLRLKS